MEPFFLAAVASFVVTLLLLLSSATTRGQYVTWRLGSAFTLRAVRPAFIFFVLLLCVVVLVLLILFIVGRVHPTERSIYRWSDFLSGRLFSSAVIGLLFGGLFAFWLRDLLWLKPTQSVGWKPVVQAVVLAILLALGAFSDILASYSRRISQISFGGAQLSFVPLKDSDAAERLGKPGLGTQYSSATGKATSSGGLSLLAQLTSRINNDRKYIETVFGTPKPASSATTDEHATFHTATFGSLAQCLQAVARQSADEAIIDEHLREIARPLQELVTARKELHPDRRKQIAEDFVRVSGTLIEHLRYTYLQIPPTDVRRQGIEESCTHLIRARCATARSADRALADLAARCPEENATIVEQTRLGLDRLLSDDTLFDRPYMSLLFAGVTWRLGQYSTATNELDGWLRAIKTSPAKTHPWHQARARIVLSGILEEWIRSSVNPPSSLAEYHLTNLRDSIELMTPMLSSVLVTMGDVAEDVEREGFRGRPPRAGDKCTSLSSDQIWLAITLLGQHAVYIFRAVQLPDYYETYSSRVMDYRNLLMKKDYFCISRNFPAFKGLIDVTYAEILEAYAEVELANASRIHALGDLDAARRALERAASAAALGLQLIFDYAEAGRKSAKDAVSFVAALEPDSARELESRFKSLQRRIAAQARAL